ncbi:hypothetical protein CC80DRAFT_553533 [Byssothecium circinans]|uniref:RING-type domain-containing protein n=1 Tax=Byssothecium circinans TaxID=147558 RepID=A0A6A5TEV9_9PLEO|nr:hypothetical protein CC80DRAFT_553533 [Byssothecium circinans]
MAAPDPDHHHPAANDYASALHDFFPTYTPPDHTLHPQPHQNYHELPDYHYHPNPLPARNLAYNPSFFDDAFHPSSTPPASFLDSLLNPIEPDQLPFGYSLRDSPPAPPPIPRDRSPFNPIPNHDMPPNRAGRPARLPNGFGNLVDLTSDSPTEPHRPARQHSPTPGPSQKRLKQNDGTALNVAKEVEIEEIDLSDGKQAVQDVLRKQREEAIKSQQKPEEQATTFNSFTCVICMDTPTDLTATACGHLFCHTCLMEALIAGENRSAPGEPRRSQCPVCRKAISRTKGSDIIPLLLKKGLATQPRKKSSVVATAKVT